MSEEQQKMYPDEQGISYSNLRVTMSKKVSEFDGQDDMFDSTYGEVSEHLTDLKEINYGSTASTQVQQNITFTFYFFTNQHQPTQGCGNFTN